MTTPLPARRALFLLSLAAGTAAVATAQGGPPPPPPPPVTALPAPPVPPQNPITEPKRLLGKVLFWDEQLSSSDTVSCGTCHQPAAGGKDGRAGLGSLHPGPDGVLGTADDRMGSHGVLRANVFGHFVEDADFGYQAQATGRSSPGNLMAAYFPNLFWDGRAGGQFRDPVTNALLIPTGGALETQSVGPILNDVEMADEGRTWDDVTAKLEHARPLAIAWDLPADIATALASDPSYPDLFQAAFGTADITPARIGLALATYQRTLVPDQSPFDDFANGVGTLTPQQMQGLQIFNSPQARCSACHGGPTFSDGGFHNLGLRPIAEDAGRFDVTGNVADRGRFKTPSLRNVALKEVFFHNGHVPFTDLTDAVAFYNGGGGIFADNRDPLLNGINIGPLQVARIADFLETLTDPRVAAELPPFDRPRMNSERPANLTTNLGGAIAGTGGLVPQLITDAPLHVGASEFRVGVRDVIGGARGFVQVTLGDPGTPIPTPGSTRLGRIQTDGFGPGGGAATWTAAIPHDPTLSGSELTVQFWVLDPGAQPTSATIQGLVSGGVLFGGSFAKSDSLRMTIQ